MKAIVVTFYLLLIMVTASFANTCPDVKDAAGIAIEERNARTTDVQNAAMADPEADRSEVFSWLESISSIGDAFSLGITIPSLEDLMGAMCNQVDSMIQEKINEAKSQINKSINEIGENSPFKVTGSGGDYSINITRKLQWWYVNTPPAKAGGFGLTAKAGGCG